MSISILYSFISQMTSRHPEQVWWETGVSGRQAAPLQVMNDTLAGLGPRQLTLIYLPSLQGAALFITSSSGNGCSPKPSTGKTQKRCVWRGRRGRGEPKAERRGTSSVRAASSGCTFLAGMNPFILKSNPRRRVGETVVLICASAISSSLGEQSICYWNR